MTDAKQPAFWAVTLRTMVVHTITYFVMGLLAFSLLNYSARFAEPPLSHFMRQTDDPLVMAGVLFQPLRGLLFGLVFYLLRDSLFPKQNGWLTAWVMLFIAGIFSTFGPAPGSIEGFVYTTIPVGVQLFGLPEVLLQSLLLSALTVYWVKRPSVRWLNRGFSILFAVVLLLPLLGLWARQAVAP